MRCGIYCIAALALAGAAPALAQLRSFSLPSDSLSWRQAQQGSLTESRFVQVIDFDRFEDGTAPLEPVRLVAVPDLPLDAKMEDLSEVERARLFNFSRRIAQRDVVARQQVEVADSTIEAGALLLPRLAPFPGNLKEVQLLIRAGVDTIPALLNVAESALGGDADTLFNRAFNLFTPSLIINNSRETPLLSFDRFQKNIQAVFDDNPFTGFERIDRVGNDVIQRWQMFIDLGRLYPIRLFRLYPMLTLPVRLASYTLLTGIPGTEKTIAGLNIDDSQVSRQPGFPRFNKIAASLPTYVVEQGVPVNTRDTVDVAFDPPRELQHLRIDFQSPLNYTLGEIELFADGFVPDAVYTTRPIGITRATLGRVFWDEEKIGNPESSRAIVQIQTGTTPEPEVFFRLIPAIEGEVEWSDVNALVIDRRPGSATRDSLVDLNDPRFNLDARVIFSALKPEERFAVRLRRAQYIPLPVNLRGKVEPDLEFWSGFQPVQNGQLIKSPSGRDFFQIRVEFLSEDPTAATAIRNLRFEFSAPQITQELGAELAPAVNVKAGIDTTFNLALRATIGGQNNGFNRLQVFTPARIQRVESLALKMGEGQVQELERIGLGDDSQVQEGQFKEVLIEDNQFVLGFPTIGPRRDGGTRQVLLRLRFVGRVVDFRTNFAVNVFLDTLGAGLSRTFSSNGILVMDPGRSDTLALFLPQPGESQDVVDFLESDQLEDRNTLSVIADVSTQGKELVTNVRVEPNPFTPNGDGFNDEMSVFYDLQRLLTPRRVDVEIFDLSGRRLKKFERNIASGGYSQAWDGRDAQGELVTPGLYLLRISVDADDAGSDFVQSISVVY